MNTCLEREPAVAGRFYPADPLALRDAMQQSFDEIEQPSAPEAVAALISPHAGIVYSGRTAAHAFARARGSSVRRAILLGCSHHYRFDCASIVTDGVFKTPLVDFPIDSELAHDLADRLGNYPSAVHLPEHSIELQLPFLAFAFGTLPIVPILFGSEASRWHKEAGEALAQCAVEGDLLVASTDLSHFYSESEANERDHRSLDTLLTQNIDSVLAAGESGTCKMCGLAAVIAAMAFAKERRALAWNILDYRTSAAASGDNSRVVGYAAVSMERAA